MGIPPTIEVANLGMADSLILMVMALVVFGPRRLPQIGRQIGKLMYEFRKASNDFKFQMEEELRNSEEADRRKQEEERLAKMTLEAPAQPTEPASEPITHVLDAGTESAGAYVPATAESPYPYESTYPAVTDADSQPVETYPRIQPPATGEPVPYNPSAEAQVDQPVPAPPADPAPANPEAPSSEEAASNHSDTGTEQAAHHG
jgi:sec-independent protein translocase protein TatB